MTETELKLIAAAATIGLSSRCAEIGYPEWLAAASSGIEFLQRHAVSPSGKIGRRN